MLRPILSASLPCTIVLKPESLARSASVFSCNSHRSLETGLSAPRQVRKLKLRQYKLISPHVDGKLRLRAYPQLSPDPLGYDDLALRPHYGNLRVFHPLPSMTFILPR